ncbi:sensor histidine kinase [Methylobacterium aquaticum]|uniref:sensor histidine kinase n=1 Tax=Methylobacterium aquaticum TaxID=270351 RepID=UPI00142F3C31|nr:ATP-binding protein [Methylobacterium aquaticum]
MLRRALRCEPVSFVKRALEQAISRITTNSPDVTLDSGEVDEPVDAERRAYRKAVEWVTNSLLHEILPRFGAIKLESKKLLADYDQSTLKARIDALTSVLDGIEELRKASISETIKETNIHDLITKILSEEFRSHTINVSCQGSREITVIADPNLLTLALSNAVRNALEATHIVDPSGSIVIAWGETDVDYWITVLDNGPGLSGPSEAAFIIGRTTKSGHRGFGLAIARQAMMTLDGTVSLQSASGGGARLEIRWFK